MTGIDGAVVMSNGHEGSGLKKKGPRQRGFSSSGAISQDMAGLAGAKAPRGEPACPPRRPGQCES